MGGGVGCRTLIRTPKTTKKTFVDVRLMADPPRRERPDAESPILVPPLLSVHPHTPGA